MIISLRNPHLSRITIQNMACPPRICAHGPPSRRGAVSMRATVPPSGARTRLSIGRVCQHLLDPRVEPIGVEVPLE